MPAASIRSHVRDAAELSRASQTGARCEAFDASRRNRKSSEAGSVGEPARSRRRIAKRSHWAAMEPGEWSPLAGASGWSAIREGRDVVGVSHGGEEAFGRGHAWHVRSRLRNEATSRILGRKCLIDQGLRKSWVWPLCGIPASAEWHSGNTRRCGPVSRSDHRMCRGRR